MIFTVAQLSALPVLDTCDVLIAGGGDAQSGVLGRYRRARGRRGDAPDQGSL